MKKSDGGGGKSYFRTSIDNIYYFVLKCGSPIDITEDGEIYIYNSKNKICYCCVPW